MRNRRVLASGLVLLASILIPASARSMSEEMKVIVDRMISEDTHDPEELARTMHQILTVDRKTGELTPEQRKKVREKLLIECVRSILLPLKGLNEDEYPGKFIESEKFLAMAQDFAPSPKEVREAASSGSDDDAFTYYPLLLISASSVHSVRRNYSLAKSYFDQATRYLDHIRQDPQLTRMYREAKSNLTVSDPYSKGSYVTNAGLMQSWIGQVVDSSGQTLKVRITYSIREGRFASSKGQVIGFNRSEVKPLERVSIDATLSGWH